MMPGRSSVYCSRNWNRPGNSLTKAFDRGIRAVERYGLPGPAERWRTVRQAIHDDVCRNGWNAGKQSFVQAYGSDALDAACLLMAQVGFIAPNDPRFIGTVAAIERELLHDGLVRRYRHDQTDDGIADDEGVFLACSFWLADAYVLLDRNDDAERLFERLLSLRNDLGLLSEQ